MHNFGAIGKRGGDDFSLPMSEWFWREDIIFMHKSIQSDCESEICLIC